MAFRTQKISQMTPKGADLEATDLIEVSTIESGSYVTRSITGQELIDAIPLPPTGLTIGTTPIASGTIGRVLFEGTGNVLQQSSSLFWDSTNNRLGIGTSTPISQIEVFASNPIISTRIASNGIGKFNYLNSAGTSEFAGIHLNANSGEFRIFANNSYFPTFYSSNAERMRIPTTGNVLINTTTDAGYKLDVNGTARVQGVLTTTPDAVVNGVNIGRGGGNNQFNARLGFNALSANTTGRDNVAFGWNASSNNTTGNNNTAVGSTTLSITTTSSNNVAVGFKAGRLTSEGGNVDIANDSVFIGAFAFPLLRAQTNQIVIGYNAIGAGSNTATLGNTSITKTILRGTINAAGLPTSPVGLSTGDVWNNLGILTIVL